MILDLHFSNLHSCRTVLSVLAAILDAVCSLQVIGVCDTQFIFHLGNYFMLLTICVQLAAVVAERFTKIPSANVTTPCSRVVPGRECN